jgi:hypothetical protein
MTVEIPPEQRERERLEQLAKLARDGRIVERIGERVASGLSGKRGRSRVELHVDIADVSVLVKYARASILGQTRRLAGDRPSPGKLEGLLERMRSTSVTDRFFDAFIDTLGLPDDQRAALLQHRGLLQNAFAAGFRLALDMLDSEAKR